MNDGADLVGHIGKLVISVDALVKADTFAAGMKLARRAGARAQIDAALDVLVSGLRVIYRLAVGISRALRSAASVLDQADALRALFDVGAAMLNALAQMAANVLPGLGLPTGSLGSIRETLDTDKLQRLVDRLPSLDEVRAIQDRLDELVGTSGDPASKDGSLGQLLAAVGAP